MATTKPGAVSQNFDGMRAGIAAVDNAFEAVDVVIDRTIGVAGKMMESDWKGTAADSWKELEEEWERVIRLANERLKDLSKTLKDILNDQVAKEGDRAQKAAQIEFTKQAGKD
ncbi:hypothetical protein AB0C77_13800 [Streptomyces sp. NPDC048629]|uniref:hypothetical protein n=1 Tax=Streptomyces sp. NPDC048629 TaxID=3154824 RepID=UPI003430D259